MKPLLSLIWGLISLSLVGLQIVAVAQTETELKQKFDDKKDSIQSQIDNIKSTLDGVAKNYEQAKMESSNLNTQVSSIQNEKREIDKLITDTKLVIGQIEKEEQRILEEDQEITESVRQIIKEMQLQEQQNFFTIAFGSNDLGSMISKMYSLSNVQKDLNSKLDELRENQRKLNETKEQNQEIQTQLEKSRLLLKSKESNLDILIQQTEGEEGKYLSLLETIKQQKDELETQLNSVDGEYLAELEGLRSNFQIEYDENAICNFEEREKINVSSDFFTTPADGWLTQRFHCGHDGIDIANQLGSNIYSIADGEVVRKGPNMNGCIGLYCNGGFGNYVVIQHDLPSNQTVYSLYAHLSSPSFKEVGQTVKRGETIAKMGCTGYTLPYPCGVHLHFVLLSDSFEEAGIGCRLGGATCYNPQKYISGIG